MNDFDNKQICLYKDINRLGFTCDVCGRKVNGCRYINGMSFCEKCYQETFGKDNQQNEIQQLKQQLAEKDKEIERLKQITIFKDSRNMTTKINGVDFSDEQIIILQNLDVLKKHDQTQLAIQELAEVERLLYESHYKEIDNRYYAEYEDIKNLIDSRIKALEKREV